jgi:hypothetical protein
MCPESVRTDTNEDKCAKTKTLVHVNLTARPLPFDAIQPPYHTSFEPNVGDIVQGVK